MTIETMAVDDYAEKMRHNPYAFPMGNPTHGGYDGMTLRDYFAAGIASGLCSAADSEGTWTAPVHDAGAAVIAQRAYAIADAMLTARKGPDHGRG